MDEVELVKGQRVSFTDKDITYTGVVNEQRRGWVMIDLDAPVDTAQGWAASKMMIRASKAEVIS